LKRKMICIGLSLTVFAIGSLWILNRTQPQTTVSSHEQSNETPNYTASPVKLPRQEIDWRQIEYIFGKKGTVTDGVWKITFPRSDLKVLLGNVQIQPALALTSWIAFKSFDDHVIIMGDLVLLESELASVLQKLTEYSIQVTAVHNHLAEENPKIIYVHFETKGRAPQMAEQMKQVLSLTSTPMEMDTPPSRITHDWFAVEKIMNRRGKVTGDVIHFSIPRKEEIMDYGIDVHGVTIPPTMGVSHIINFQAIGSDKAAATGDFVLTAHEVHSVFELLTKNGITVTALHNHMIHETPRLFFMHFWGEGNSEQLASILQAAVEKTNGIKSK
jgi:hypothetical protein